MLSVQNPGVAASMQQQMPHIGHSNLPIGHGMAPLQQQQQQQGAVGGVVQQGQQGGQSWPTMDIGTDIDVFGLQRTARQLLHIPEPPADVAMSGNFQLTGTTTQGDQTQQTAAGLSQDIEPTDTLLNIPGQNIWSRGPDDDHNLGRRGNL